jgi:hypothetical protein
LSTLRDHRRASTTSRRIVGLGGGTLFVAARRGWVGDQPPIAYVALDAVIGVIALLTAMLLRAKTASIARRDRTPSDETDRPPSSRLPRNPYRSNPFSGSRSR